MVFYAQSTGAVISERERVCVCVCVPVRVCVCVLIIYLSIPTLPVCEHPTVNVKMVSFRRYRRLLPSTLALCFTVVSLYGLIHSDTWEGLYRHLLSVPQTRNNASAPHTRNNGSAPQTRDNASAPQTRKGEYALLHSTPSPPLHPV